MKELPVRKHPRLKGYDYSKNGVYFITFCVKDRHEMLGQINVGRGIQTAQKRFSQHPPILLDCAEIQTSCHLGSSRLQNAEK